jgi:hypothetical protein
MMIKNPLFPLLEKVEQKSKRTYNEVKRDRRCGAKTFDKEFPLEFAFLLCLQPFITS